MRRREARGLRGEGIPGFGGVLRGVLRGGTAREGTRKRDHERADYTRGGGAKRRRLELPALNRREGRRAGGGGAFRAETVVPLLCEEDWFEERDPQKESANDPVPVFWLVGGDGAGLERMCEQARRGVFFLYRSVRARVAVSVPVFVCGGGAPVEGLERGEKKEGRRRKERDDED